MNSNTLGKAALVTGIAASAIWGSNAPAQSLDPLLDKLVNKGILTTQEAKELQEESNNGFSKAYQAKSGMPDWVTALKLNGDFRGRFEGFFFDYRPEPASGPDVPDRLRYRYRVRAGLTAVMLDRLEVGFRLTSSEFVEGFGGDPISGNTTLRDNASKKFIFVDLAYGKWTAVNNRLFTDTLTIGKMENPFVLSDMVFDSDYTPEGAANQLTYRLTDKHALKLNAGAFVLDEIGGSSKDPWLYGAQLRWDGVWSPRFQTTVGVATLGIDEKQNLTDAAVPNINTGNSRTGGVLDNNFHPIIGDAGVTYTFDQVPLFPGKFPVRLHGEYLHNPAADIQNSAFMFGITLGKAGKRRTWALDYRYKYIEADAWYEEFLDSDFGVLRPTLAYGVGTNIKGHTLRASYSPFDALTLGVSYMLTELVKEPVVVPANFDDDTGRLQVDAIWKF